MMFPMIASLRSKDSSTPRELDWACHPGASMAGDKNADLMRHGWPLLLTVLLICLALPSAAGAVCAPEKMVRIVTRDVSPGVAAEPFREQPKTLYRLGTRYGRVEELPNPASGLHLLVVINEPDVWMVNRRDGTGRHSIDPGPTFHVRAPVFERPGLPATLADLEHGCERAYFSGPNVKSSGTAGVGGRRCDLRTVDAATFRVTLCLDPGTRTPRRVSLYERDAVLAVLEYDAYEDALPADLSLFARPRGVKFSEPAR